MVQRLGLMQSAQQSSQIECDNQLGAVFQAKQVKLSSLSHRINPHLRPVEPLSLRYTVKSDPCFFLLLLAVTHMQLYGIDLSVSVDCCQCLAGWPAV